MREIKSRHELANGNVQPACPEHGVEGLPCVMACARSDVQHPGSSQIRPEGVANRSSQFARFCFEYCCYGAGSNRIQL